MLFLLKQIKKSSSIQISIKETLYCSISMKPAKTKEILITPLLLGIIFSVLISNAINNQQVLAQQQQQQLSPEKMQNQILRGTLNIQIIDVGTTATTDSSV